MGSIYLVDENYTKTYHNIIAYRGNYSKTNKFTVLLEYILDLDGSIL